MIHLASFANCCDDIEELVQAGADVNAIGDLGLRPLHYAVLAGSSDAVHLLLLKGIVLYITLASFLSAPPGTP
ncbi:ankyrin repeat domain-containing protein [Ralstonia solanacearum]|uniref:ankyrin repeat domain-containing protein n=1 Tax=Ralstonia solanacearum TaxID=305 RepID=UPI003CC52D10